MQLVAALLDYKHSPYFIFNYKKNMRKTNKKENQIVPLFRDCISSFQSFFFFDVLLLKFLKL